MSRLFAVLASALLLFSVASSAAAATYTGPVSVTLTVAALGGNYLSGVPVWLSGPSYHAEQTTPPDGIVRFTVPSNGSYGIVVYSGSVAGYLGYSASLFIAANQTSASTLVILSPIVPVASTFTASTEGYASGAYQGVNVTLTDQGYSAVSADVLFVWKDAALQTVAMQAAVNVGFKPGESESFFQAEIVPGIYTMCAFVLSASQQRPMSASYCQAVTISGG